MAEPTSPPADPPKDNPPPTDPPAPGAGGESSKPKDGDNLPEKFKGKSAEEIAKSYLELEQLHGKTTAEVESAKKKILESDALVQLIKSNPVLLNAVKGEIERLTKTPENKDAPKRDDTKIAVVGQIIDKFEGDNGLTKMPKEEKTKVQDAIGNEIWTMRDPSHSAMTREEAFNSIPADQLGAFLDKAYKNIVNSADEKEQARLKGFIEATQNREAAMGSMSFSGVKTGSITLTQDQKDVARKMHISEEKYIQNLKEMQEET